MLAVAVVVFISFSHRDSVLMKSVSAELREAGCVVWTDEKIKKGALWDREVMAAIDRADVVLSIVSKSSFESKNVHRELSYADALEKRMVPVIAEPKSPIPFALQGLEWATLGHLGEDVGCQRGKP